MSMRFDVAVVGSVNLDFVICTKTLPTAGETLGNGSFLTTPGGKGANQALAAQRLGANTKLYAAVGADPYADEALVNLREDGVDLSSLRVLSDIASGAAFVNVDDNGENQIAVASGANNALSADGFDAIDATWVIAQLEVPTDVILAAAQRRTGYFCLNAAPAQSLDVAIFDLTDMLVVNEVEWEFYRSALSNYTGDIVLTLGAKGAVLLRDGDEIARAHAPKVDVVDTTGAGDTFVGGLVTAMIAGMASEKALQWACCCGALATAQLGAQASIPYRDDVQRLFDAQ